MTGLDSILARPSLFRTLLLVAITAVSLGLVDGILARTERSETATAAGRFYREGQRLLKEGKAAAAAEQFRSAIANARDNADYHLALGEAQLDANRLDEAAETLTELLKGNSMAGNTNLAMARVEARKGRTEEAASYYHRAIYGQWKENPQANQVIVRFELVDLLLGASLLGASPKEKVLAELLPLQDQTTADAAAQQKLARLYLAAESPARAAAIFRELVRMQPQDAATHEGLGEAEFARGNYSTAQASFRAALRLRPEDEETRKRADMCSQILELDPMRRGLGAEERYKRSVRLLELASDAVTRCTVPQAATPLVEMLDSARTAIQRRPGIAHQEQAIDGNLDIASKLWQTGTRNCASAASPDEEALRLVLAKLVQ